MSRFPNINIFEKMSNAVIGARNLVKGAHNEWWLAGKHNEVAESYLALREKRSNEANIVQKNLDGVFKLSEGIPLLSEYIYVQCTDIGKKCEAVVEGTRRRIAGYATEVPGAFWGKYYNVVVCETWFKTSSLDEQWRRWRQEPKETIALSWLEISNFISTFRSPNLTCHFLRPTRERCSTR
jgi:hypothetical protein